MMAPVEERQRHAARELDPNNPLPVVAPSTTFETVSEQISSIVLTRKTPLFWWCCFGFGIFLLIWFAIAVTYLLGKGVGIWGIEIPNGWGFAITNFVWWIGIGHAGTLISAILLLLNQSWRNSINRFAEAMTIFAVMCAGLFPLLHLGRSWIFYWVFPYPNTMTVQPNFRSPLVWDVFAVSTYFTISVLFWYLGMIPDLAMFRDRAVERWKKAIYGIMCFGWRGASHEWKWHQSASLLLAGLATPLVLSVHTVVSFDFTIAILPGWHSTIFPPYFVAGAIYSGFAMVVVLAIPLRSVYGLHNLLTVRHLNNCGKLMLATGLVLAYTYCIEPFTAWYSGNEFEMAVVRNRAFGPQAWSFWGVILLNVIIPQGLWFYKVRVKPQPLFFMGCVVLVGMWLERYMIIVTSLGRDFLPSSWATFVATFWDNATLYGSVGLFITLFMLFVRFLPMVPVAEVRELLPFSKPGGGTEK
ncbi:MAG TPA: NrfD/PsrC family molybdoenzyme membrane anchor subunit [Bryobacteraceae bacterium]|nr:NrfD/PsrC family molybdoenzyme membrane anchor subunit [Bryobacteraceae bacterium]